ncbi:hypothetical protein [Streptomyces sp. H39-C1]|uniref:hypothetical protein n=1 Tax=Streptomyces sp. H39-C1 TaxID=3004355 RepID=UPI0022B069E5|nr:hypothetical protein [Streptomyces sp. H39-C1]MCZ4100750.1 hypothetical protein [Streptomyces sp. H39-C1]
MPPEAASPASEFPGDLVQAQRELIAARAERLALIAGLPHRTSPMPEPYLVNGRVVAAHEGWTQEAGAAVDAVAARERELAVRLVEHPHWKTYKGHEAVKARFRLQGMDV